MIMLKKILQLVSKLTSTDNLQSVHSKINDSYVLNHIFDYGAQFAGVDNFGTSQVSILAPNGDAVSVTSSIND